MALSCVSQVQISFFSGDVDNPQIVSVRAAEENSILEKRESSLETLRHDHTYIFSSIRGTIAKNKGAVLSMRIPIVLYNTTTCDSIIMLLRKGNFATKIANHLR